MEGPESSLVPGYRLDRYELLCPIASGGMATVWLARLLGKRGFEKLFAVKTIKTELISDAHFQEMFLDEARIAARIVHPNVAQILELGEQNDILFIVMEYVDGDSLAKINRLALKLGSPLPPGVALRIVAEACAGLHAAHQLKDAAGESLGVVHRDVSPQNILVTTEGSAKVIDFGLVKAKNRSAGETDQGVVKGKIRYMAPEQITGRGIDRRADVWAAGMCLYELLSGHVPYHQDDDLGVVKRLMSDAPVPPLDVALPPQIERVLTKAIVKDPRARFESCAQMRRAIESAIQELELPAENEHVAEFLAQALPDLASKRAATLAKAIDGADSRQPSTDSIEGLGSADVAFAATEISGRSRDETAAVPLTRRSSARRAREESDAEQSVSSYGAASRTTSHATSLRAQLGEQKKRDGLGLFVVVGVAIGAGAWLVWPRSDARNASPPPSLAPDAPDAPAAAAMPASVDLPPPIDLDSDLDSGAARSGSPRAGMRRALVPPTSASVETAPARTYNPAWSILTNPPEAGLPAPATSEAPSLPASPPPDDAN